MADNKLKKGLREIMREGRGRKIESREEGEGGGRKTYNKGTRDKNNEVATYEVEVEVDVGG
jgi:hypothetical protein